MMVDDLDSPSAGVSSLSSTRTLPVRNCPGKYRRFVLSKRIKNLTSFLVMLTVTVHKARADVTDSRSHSCPLRALTDSPSHQPRPQDAEPSRAFRQRSGWGASRRKYPMVGVLVADSRSCNSRLFQDQQQQYNRSTSVHQESADRSFVIFFNYVTLSMNKDNTYLYIVLKKVWNHHFIYLS